MADGIIKLDEGWRLDAGHRLDQPPNVPPPVPAVLPAKKRKHTMTEDYIPGKRGNNYLWWKGLKDNIALEGPKFGLTAGEITAVETLATAQMTAMEATDAAKTALDGARSAEQTATAANEAAIRVQVRYWKTKPLYAASGSEGVLQLKGPESGFDPNTFKSKVKLMLTGGHVKVEFTKGRCDMVAVYARLRGESGWTKLGTDSQSPYYDTRPPAAPGAPEVREYRVVGIIDDVEIGLPSDIVSITYDAAP